MRVERTKKRIHNPQRHSPNVRSARTHPVHSARSCSDRKNFLVHVNALCLCTMLVSVCSRCSVRRICLFFSFYIFHLPWKLHTEQRHAHNESANFIKKLEQRTNRLRTHVASSPMPSSSSSHCEL